MIIRMTKWKSKPGLDEESKQIWKDAVRPVWYRQPGLVRAHLLYDANTLERMTFSVWETEEDYEAFKKSADLQYVIDAYAHIYAPNTSTEPRDWGILSEDWNCYDESK